jgi:hypothetical protein
MMGEYTGWTMRTPLSYIDLSCLGDHPMPLECGGLAFDRSHFSLEDGPIPR